MHEKEKASEASAKHAGVWSEVCEWSKRLFRFALASGSLAILSLCSTIEFKKYEKIEGCEQYMKELVIRVCAFIRYGNCLSYSEKFGLEKKFKIVTSSNEMVVGYWLFLIFL